MRKSRRGISTLLAVLMIMSSVTVFPGNVSVEAALPDSTVLEMKMDENLNDSTGNNTPALIGTENFVEGKKGKAFKFDGSTYIDLGTDSALRPSDITISFWVNPGSSFANNTGKEEVFFWSKDTYNSNGWTLSSENNNNPIVLSIGPSDVNGQPYKVGVLPRRTEFFPANKWTHVIVTFHNITKEVKIYRNGLRQDVKIYNNVGDTGATGVIGDMPGLSTSMGWNGPANQTTSLTTTMDEVAIYNTSVTSEEAVSIYQNAGGELTEGAIVSQDAEKISIPSTTRGNITLPTIGFNGSVITWTSNKPAYLTADGTVNRLDNDDVIVNLTAELVYGSATVKKNFNVTVLAKNFQTLIDVPLEDVELLDDYYVNAFDKEVDYLLAFDIDRFIYHFRDTAGLSTQGAAPYEGWENRAIRGHTAGHYLSAVARAYNSTAGSDKTALRSKLEYMVTELEKCQDAYTGSSTGYLAAYPESHLDYLEGGPYPGESIWVPWYNTHKTVQGLIDVHLLTDGTLSTLALEMASDLGDYIYNRVSQWDDSMKAAVLATEYGGMNDCLYQLYALTGNSSHLAAAEKFDETTLFNDLINNGGTTIEGKHANTNIPKFIGALQRYIQLGQADSENFYLEAAEKFWDIVVNEQSYVTGGNSYNEHFRTANRQVEYFDTSETCETCNSYNMLVLSRMLYKLTGAKHYADFYENAYINAIMASQNPETGMTTYYQPMGVGYHKVYSRDFDEFWCCTGSGMESMSKLNDSYYYTSQDRNTLYVNMYISSSVKIAENNFKLTQSTNIPASETTTFTVSALNNGTIDAATIKFRIPDWEASDGVPTVKINGTVQSSVDIDAKGYVSMSKSWSDGDTIELTFKSEVVVYELPDSSVMAFKYGPIVLGAGLGGDASDMIEVPHGVLTRKSSRITKAKRYIYINDTSVDTWKENIAENLVRTSLDSLEFTLNGTDEDGSLIFTPFYQLHDECYGLYYTFVEVDSKELQDYILDSKNASRLVSATISNVPVSNDQFESEKNFIQSDSLSGSWNSKSLRYASSTGWFSYDMEIDTSGIANYILMTYASADVGRNFDIIISGKTKSKTFNYTVETKSEIFYNYILQIPSELLADAKDKINSTTGAVEYDENGNTIPVLTIKFSGNGSSNTGRLFDYVRVIKDYNTDPTLSGLKFDVGKLSKSFNKNTTDYTLTVPTATESIVMNAVLSNENGLVYVNDILIDDKFDRTITLTGDTTEIILKTYAEDQQANMVYNVNIVKSDDPGLTAPTNLKLAKASAASVKLSWTNASGADGCEVWYATAQNGNYTKAGSTAGSSYVHEKLTIGRTYYYKLRSYKIVNGKTYYSDYTGAAPLVLPVPKPANIKTASAGAASIKISWKKVSGASGYVIYRATSKNGKYKEIKTLSAGKSNYTNKNLTNGKTYYYKIRAYKTIDSAKKFSSYTDAIKRKAALSKPVGAKAKAGKGSVKLSWKKVAGATSYEIYRAMSKNGKYGKVAAVSKKKLSYSNRNLTKGKVYYFKINAVQKIGKKTYRSKYSVKISAKVK